MEILATIPTALISLLAIAGMTVWIRAGLNALSEIREMRKEREALLAKKKKTMQKHQTDKDFFS